MRQSDDKILMYGDADAIKEFVFETSSLPQIRGGSQLLLECENKIPSLAEKAGGEIIYCNGGGFLLEISKNFAEKLKQDIERVYLDTMLVSTVTIAYEQNVLPPLTHAPEDGWAARLRVALPEQVAQPDDDFDRRVSFLAARVREAKAQKREAPFFEALPFGQRCQACGKRMAVQAVPRPEPEDRTAVENIALCPVCFKRHEEGKLGKGQTRGKFNQDFQKYTSPKASQAPDLDHLVRSAHRNYLAFIYADGNDIGSLLLKVKNREEYEALSDALREGMKNALFGTLKKVCAKALVEEEYWPFEIVNVGGDDVTLLIQAGYAWEVAVKFLEYFEQEIEERLSKKLGYRPDGWPQRITASCSIAIAHANYPMRYLEKLAEGLLKEAKRRAKKEPNHPKSAMNFLWLPNPVTSETVRPLMARYQHNNDTNIELTARPYSLDQARQIMTLAEKASQWSRSQRHLWGEAVKQGMWVSLNTIYYNIAHRNDESRKCLTEFLGEVGQVTQANHPANMTPTLWQQDLDENVYRTALLDVLELAELRAIRPDVKEEEVEA
jgi:hypothetical protein